MTSGTILPSIGPPPPEFRRPQVPENLRPKLASEIVEEPPRQNPPLQTPVSPSRPDETQSGDALLQLAQQLENGGTSVSTVSQVVTPENGSPPNTNLGGPAAVAVQVQESEPHSHDTHTVTEQKLQGELTEEEKAVVERLRERDREVRAHENAHASVGRGYTGSPNFEFARGPDGIQYAVGGHVDIDVGEVPNDPEATIAKMEVVRSAALAPARPSGQDRAVAAAAEAAIREAQGQLAEERREALLEGGSEGGDDASSTNIASASPALSSVTGTVPSPQGGEQTSTVSSIGVTGSTAPQTISIDLLV